MSLKLFRFPFSIRWDNAHKEWIGKQQQHRESAVQTQNFVNMHVCTAIYRKRLEEIYQNVHIAYLQMSFFILFSPLSFLWWASFVILKNKSME